MVAPGKKIDCDCDTADHTEPKQCEEFLQIADIIDHITIIAKVMVGSKTINVAVGEGEQMQVFEVHRDVLTLLSGEAGTRIQDAAEPDEEELELPEIKPALFADFISWMYSGDFLQAPKIDPNTSAEHIWTMGQFLQAPSFQNFCMKTSIISDYRDEKRNWMTAASLKSVYRVTKKDSKLRKLAADLVNCLQPHREGTKTQKDSLAELRKTCSDFDADAQPSRDKKWKGKNGVFPWDLQFREDYLEEETPLDEAWERQILKNTSSRTKIRDMAKTGEVHSSLEFIHLEFMKAKRKGKGRSK
ncbi:uncharacterized protein LY89DRAFT_731469 [Mollisia scopiformis]|uniref:BTB domain-containing protein n=1 Tax=Mollisia scopiformis TaxID=149040 RepID=A0A194XFZ0_MOLSC|nr:uncharacterized protein LY89DRAFT_731469 [Mollisia scopiformis]KUJ19044.1 hypothetical protein LY89DRAFT_731469 [Mollisia scopiformis]